MTELDYAQPLKWSRRPLARRVWKGALALVALVVCLALGRIVWVKGEVMLPQRACSNYSAPATKVVYDEGPGAAALIASRGEYVPITSNMGPGAPPAAAAVPGCWRRLAAVTNCGPASGATIFLGRRSVGGVEYIVAVQYVPPNFAMSFTSNFVEGFNVASVIVTPETLTRSAVATQMSPPIDVTSWTPTVPPNLRIYAGQPDPADASKFTIDYEMWGIRDTLDCWLDINGFVRFEPRKRPEQPR